MTELITHDALVALLQYNRVSGLFTWRVSPNRRIVVGSVAGTRSDTGYVKIKIGQRLYRAHRLAWFYVTGMWPQDEIDHRNTVRTDNRWRNLRLADRSTNCENLREAKSHSQSGLLGTIPNKITGKWNARIAVRGRNIHLGTYADAEPAHLIYLMAKRELHAGSTI